MEIYPIPLIEIILYRLIIVTVAIVKDLQAQERQQFYLLQKKHIEMQGTPKFYEVKGSSGSHVRRGFCENCGSGVLSYAKEIPHIQYIKAGTLNDSSWIKVDSNFFTDSAHDWNKPDESIKSFKGNPSIISNIKTLFKSF